MTGIFSRLLITALTFSIGVFLVPAPISAPLPGLPPVTEEYPLPEPLPLADDPPLFPEPPAIRSTSKTGELAAIGIFTQIDMESGPVERRIERPSRPPVYMDMELGENIEDEVIALYPFPGDKREFRVEQQFETSMSVTEEGPHLDLTDWKHYTSEWRELKRIEKNWFRTFTLTEEERSRFPAVTREEIYKVVLKDGGKGMAELARTCKGPKEGACIVTASRISIRILARINGRWTVIHQIDAMLPMGC